MPATADDILTQYTDAVKAAAVAYNSSAERLNQIQAQLDAIPAEEIGDGTGPRAAEAKSLQSQIDSLQKTYGTAQQEYTQILHQRADAVTKAKDDADPARRASLEAQAKADIAKANQIDVESKEFVEAAPDRRAAAKDASRLAKAKADEAEYALGVEKETDPARRATAQAALDRAKADTARVVAETSQIGKAAPQTPEQQRQAAAGATVAEAQAGTAAPAATANLSKLEADAAMAQVELTDAQRKAAQAPTDAQAQQAITTAQRNLDLANQGLEDAQAQTRAEGPGRLAQQGATLEQTQAATDASRATVDKAKQGDLYGLQDKIKQIRDLIASGEVKPTDGDAMVQAAQRGTDIYSVMKQQADEKSTARGQDVSNKNSLAGTFGSTFNNSLSQFQQMNQTGAVGSDATGKAFLATLGLAQDYLKSYEMPAATPTDYLGQQAAPSPVGGMVNQAQQQLAAAPPPMPAPVASAPPVTINIGGGGPALLPAGDTGTQRDPMVAGSPAGGPPPAYGGPGGGMTGASGDMLARAASQGTMATKGEVLKTLFPRHAGMMGL